MTSTLRPHFITALALGLTINATPANIITRDAFETFFGPTRTLYSYNEDGARQAERLFLDGFAERFKGITGPFHQSALTQTISHTATHIEAQYRVTFRFNDHLPYSISTQIAPPHPLALNTLTSLIACSFHTLL